MVRQLDLVNFARSVCLAWGLLLSLASGTVAAETVVDFHNDIIPLLTKHGCNAGACHGAAIGRGGFKLSLYGGEPLADYDALVRQLGGRRVHLTNPEQSLVVRKPSEQLEHGGGMVFADDSNSAGLLVRWIEQGVDDVPRRQFVRAEITPTSHVASTLGAPIELRATAHYTDGSQRDVTSWTVFTAEDNSAVQLTNADLPDRPTLAVMLRRGRHVVVARYLEQVIPIELITPLTDLSRTPAQATAGNFIDQQIDARLATLGLEPSPPALDTTFLRRVTLDLTGRLPSLDSASAFAANEQVDRRTQLVDALLQSDAFTEYWTFQLAKLLRVRPQPNDTQGMQAYHDWIALQVRKDASYQEMAQQLILASGDSHVEGPANFHRTVDGPRQQAEFVSELFMGSRLRCANCHNHPLDRWTQDDYHGLAAIFAKLERGRTIRSNSTGQTIHPRTLEPARARIPGEFFLHDASHDGRQELADWLTDSANPYFAKAVVNRLWKHMLGRGLVEPVDDFRDTNPATHPELLDQLAEDFVTHGYRLRHTLRQIALSDTYARSANATEHNREDQQFYSHFLRRPLEPEVLADALSEVLGVAETYGDEAPGARAVTIVNPQTPSPSLDILGRCQREESCENPRAAVGGLAQKLHLFNGNLLNARISAPGSRLRRHLEAKTMPLEIIAEFYLAAFGRHPSQNERAHWRHALDASENQNDFLEDFVWGLLSSRDFGTNH